MMIFPVFRYGQKYFTARGVGFGVIGVCSPVTWRDLLWLLRLLPSSFPHPYRRLVERLSRFAQEKRKVVVYDKPWMKTRDVESDETLPCA